jgi:cytidine deaminase
MRGYRQLVGDVSIVPIPPRQAILFRTAVASSNLPKRRHDRKVEPGVDQVVVGTIAVVEQDDLRATVDACRSLIRDRFHDDHHHGAAAMLLDDGTIVTGTAPEAINSSVQVCHETEPYCAAFRLGRHVVASVCLHREPSGRTLVLSPCGVCRERLAGHGPNVLVAVADVHDSTQVSWKSLKDVLPNYWMTAFPDEIDSAWTN